MVLFHIYSWSVLFYNKSKFFSSFQQWRKWKDSAIKIVKDYLLKQNICSNIMRTWNIFIKFHLSFISDECDGDRRKEFGRDGSESADSGKISEGSCDVLVYLRRKEYAAAGQISGWGGMYQDTSRYSCDQVRSKTQCRDHVPPLWVQRYGRWDGDSFYSFISSGTGNVGYDEKGYLMTRKSDSPFYVVNGRITQNPTGLYETNLWG